MSLDFTLRPHQKVPTKVEAWKEGFAANCKVDCDKFSDELNKFNAAMSDVKNKGQMTLDFSKEGIEVKLQTRAGLKSASIPDPAFAKELLRVFIGGHPPTKEFKKGILGQN